MSGLCGLNGLSGFGGLVGLVGMGGLSGLGVLALLFCARMKLAQIQCKSQINRNFSSQVTLDGHCFHGKVASWCPPTFDKVSQPCACVHACTCGETLSKVEGHHDTVKTMTIKSNL